MYESLENDILRDFGETMFLSQTELAALTPQKVSSLQGKTTICGRITKYLETRQLSAKVLITAEKRNNFFYSEYNDKKFRKHWGYSIIPRGGGLYIIL